MSKILITSGCSFSECISTYTETWPKHLYRALEMHGYTEHISCAMGSQGNGLISRGIMYNVSKALETYCNDDILVGVMWSHSSRLDYRCFKTNLLSFGSKNVDGWIENPTGFVNNADKNWVIMNNGWTNEEATTYYKYFFDFTGSSIYSIEHILRTQWFLQNKKIKYFFTNFIDNNIVDFSSGDYEYHKDEIDYLYDLIDKSYYLPVTSEHAWILNYSDSKEEFDKQHYNNGKRGLYIHPNTEQHLEFMQKVIYPYIFRKGYL